VKTTISGITVEYPEAGAPVKISGEGTFEGLDLFELYSVLRAVYNQRNRVNQMNGETKVLRKIALPPIKADKRL